MLLFRGGAAHWSHGRTTTQGDMYVSSSREHSEWGKAFAKEPDHAAF